jgi:hypothetical protein
MVTESNVPDEDIERMHTLARQAIHDSVTLEKLAEKDPGLLTRSLQDDALYQYLDDGEVPHFIFHADQKTPEVNGPSSPAEIDRSRRYKVWHLISDRHWLMVAGNRSGDQVSTVPLDDIEATNFSTNEEIISEFAANVFVLELDDGHVRVPISKKYSQNDLDALSRYLRDKFGALRGGTELDPEDAGYTAAGKDSLDYGPEAVRNRLDRIPEDAMEDAEEIVEDAEDPDALVNELDGLYEEYEEGEEKSVKDVVEDATSVDDLRQEVEKPRESVTRLAIKHAEVGYDEAQKTLEDADPE